MNLQEGIVNCFGTILVDMLICCVYWRLFCWHESVKRIKYEIRLGEPNRPMSTSLKKVEPILCVGPWQNEGLDLPTKFQKTCFTRMKLALQGWNLLRKEETCSARMRLVLQGEDLLYKERRQDLTTIKKPQHPHKKVRVTNSSLAL